MTFILFFVISLATVLFILLPLFDEPFWPRPVKTLLTELRRQKKIGIWAIADVDDEFEMGKLSEDDHALLRAHLKTELLAIMKREKDLAADIGKPEGRDITPDLKQKLVYEVVRICGLKRS